AFKFIILVGLKLSLIYSKVYTKKCTSVSIAASPSGNPKPDLRLRATYQTSIRPQEGTWKTIHHSATSDRARLCIAQSLPPGVGRGCSLVNGNNTFHFSNTEDALTWVKRKSAEQKAVISSIQVNSVETWHTSVSTLMLGWHLPHLELSYVSHTLEMRRKR
ncbi:hypothetical protein K491DRAFT_685661, partial [Lophiostoma macrostomum CBS 122681]